MGGGGGGGGGGAEVLQPLGSLADGCHGPLVDLQI